MAALPHACPRCRTPLDGSVGADGLAHCPVCTLRFDPAAPEANEYLPDPGRHPSPPAQDLAKGASIDSAVFDLLERSAQHRTPAIEPKPGAQRMKTDRHACCPVCGHAFMPSGQVATYACPECGTHFEPGTGRMRAAPKPAAADPLIGRTVRGCRIDRKIGEGGMGAVYHARQLSLERSVAIKVLPAELARNRNFIARFEREAKSLARINHPNILHVYDFGEDATLAIYFMIMEFVDGRDLGEILHRRVCLDQLEVLDLLRQAAMGLETAAEKGVIHRDIKPDNLMVGGDGVIKVSDFGLAKGYADEKDVTQVGVRVGTPAFMSPEQCDGVDVDSRSDVYNLACTAFLALTGRLPYDGETPFAIMLKHKNDPVPSVREANPAVDARVDALVASMLAKRPDDRCRNLRDLVDRIEQVMVALTGSASILRKTRGPFRALVRDQRDSPPSGPSRDQTGRSELPITVPEPAKRDPQPVAMPAPGATVSVPVKMPGALMGAMPERPVAHAPQPVPMPLQVPTAKTARAAEADPIYAEPAPAEAPSEERIRPPRRNEDIGQARSRGRIAQFDAIVESAERLTAAGDHHAAAGEYRRAAAMAPDHRRAETLLRDAKRSERRAGRRRFLRIAVLLVLLLGLGTVAVWQGAPRVHIWQLNQRLAHAEVAAPQAKRDLYAEVAAAEPYPWYERVFQTRYALPPASAAAAWLAAHPHTKGPDTQGPQPQGPDAVVDQTVAAALTALRRLADDPAVAWSNVAAAAQRLIASATAATSEQRAQATQIAAAAQRETEAIAAGQAVLSAALARGDHGQALDLADKLRAARLLADERASLPLPARVMVVDLATGAAQDAALHVDGIAVSITPTAGNATTGYRVCRSRERVVVVEANSPGRSRETYRLVPDPDVAEQRVRIALGPAPAWTTDLGGSGFAHLHPAPGAVLVLRADGLTRLRLADGQIDARYATDSTGLTQHFSRSSDGVIQVGDDAGRLLPLDAITLAEQPHLLRLNQPLLAAVRRPSPFRTDVVLRYAVVGRGAGARLLVLNDAGSERWRFDRLVCNLMPALFFAGDAVVVIDDTQVRAWNEDGTAKREQRLAGTRIAATSQLGSDLHIVPTAKGVQALRFGVDGQPQAVDLPGLLTREAFASAASDVLVQASQRELSLSRFDAGALRPGWQATLPLHATGLWCDQAVLVALDDGSLEARALTDGALRLRVRHGSSPPAHATVRDGVLLVAYRNGAVAAWTLP